MKGSVDMSLENTIYKINTDMNSAQDDFYNILTESSRIEFLLTKYSDFNPATLIYTGSIIFYCNTYFTLFNDKISPSFVIRTTLKNLHSMHAIFLHSTAAYLLFL